MEPKLASRDSWLEAQIADLGTSLAIQLDGKLKATCTPQDVSSPGNPNNLDQLADILRRDAGLLVENVRDEVRLVRDDVGRLEHRLVYIETRMLRQVSQQEVSLTSVSS